MIAYIIVPILFVGYAVKLPAGQGAVWPDFRRTELCAGLAHEPSGPFAQTAGIPGNPYFAAIKRYHLIV